LTCLTRSKDLVEADKNISDLGWLPEILPKAPGDAKWELSGRDTLVLKTDEKWNNSTEYTGT
jgi:hypothetical protein